MTAIFVDVRDAPPRISDEFGPIRRMAILIGAMGLCGTTAYLASTHFQRQPTEQIRVAAPEPLRTHYHKSSLVHDAVPSQRLPDSITPKPASVFGALSDSVASVPKGRTVPANLATTLHATSSTVGAISFVPSLVPVAFPPTGRNAFDRIASLAPEDEDDAPDQASDDDDAPVAKAMPVRHSHRSLRYGHYRHHERHRSRHHRRHGY